MPLKSWVGRANLPFGRNEFGSGSVQPSMDRPRFQLALELLRFVGLLTSEIASDLPPPRLRNSQKAGGAFLSDGGRPGRGDAALWRSGGGWGGVPSRPPPTGWVGRVRGLWRRGPFRWWFGAPPQRNPTIPAAGVRLPPCAWDREPSFSSAQCDGGEAGFIPKGGG